MVKMTEFKRLNMLMLVRYIILPLLLWWLITGGYESFIPSKSADPGKQIQAPRHPSQVEEKIVSLPAQPRITRREDEKSNEQLQPSMSVDSPKLEIDECESIKSNLMSAWQREVTVSAKSIATGFTCDLTDDQKRRVLQHSLNKYKENRIEADALEILEVYKKTFPKDSHPYLEEIEIHERRGDPSQAVEAFLAGYELSLAKSDIDPKYFLTTLKSLQKLGRICEQRSVLSAMLVLDQLKPELKRSIAKQIQLLESRCESP
jgi:hypothetical protein